MRSNSPDPNTMMTVLFLASLFGKGAAKTAAKSGSKITVKAGSKIGVKAGVAIGAVGLLSVSNIFQGDGILGGIGEALGLDGLGDTFIWILFGIVAVVILMFALKR